MVFIIFTQTEKDFAEIAGAGLNFVRIPIPYWAIETRGSEPFLAGTSWTYVPFTTTAVSRIIVRPTAIFSKPSSGLENTAFVLILTYMLCLAVRMDGIILESLEP